MTQVRISTSNTQKPLLDFKIYTGNKKQAPRSSAMTQVPVELGSRHSPISYCDFSKAINEHLSEHKLRVLQTAHSISKGNIYFGMNEVAYKNRSFVPVVAWRASHNQRVSASIYLGAGIPQYNIVTLADEIHVFARHSANFAERLPFVINEVLGQLRLLIKEQHRNFKLFQDMELTNSEAESHIIDMMREDIIPTSGIAHAVSLWDDPLDGDVKQNVWRLFLAVSESYKPKGSTDAVSTLLNRSPKLMAYCKGIVLDKL